LGGFVPSVDRFTETAEEYGPEPTKKKGADEAAAGRIEENPVRAGLGIPAGRASYGETEPTPE